MSWLIQVKSLRTRNIIGGHQEDDIDEATRFVKIDALLQCLHMPMIIVGQIITNMSVLSNYQSGSHKNSFSHLYCRLWSVSVKCVNYRLINMSILIDLIYGSSKNSSRSNPSMIYPLHTRREDFAFFWKARCDLFLSKVIFDMFSFFI